MEFTQEDREQFAQLIGYSHSGSGDLGYVSDEVWVAAEQAYQEDISELEARCNYLRGELNELKAAMKGAVARLYGKHPDDLTSF
jgi:hypothetical protein